MVEESPLITTTLIRSTLSLPEGDSLEALLSLKRESWGIRSYDRMLTGANPMHDQNLYQILYALTESDRGPEICRGGRQNPEMVF